MDRLSFIKQVAAVAVKDYKYSKVLPSLVIAQCILESAWGQSKLSREANNYFGIKAGSNWHGKTYKIQTGEYSGNKKYMEYATFRSYDSLYESIKDHNKLLMLPRYQKVIQTTDYKKACYEVRAAGYATDPNYTNLLISLIEQYKLYTYDMEVLEMIEKVKVNMCGAMVNAECIIKKEAKGDRTFIDIRELEKSGVIKVDYRNGVRYISIK